MKLDEINQTRILVKERLHEVMENGNFIQGKEGWVFHLDAYRTAKVFKGSPSLANLRARIQYDISSHCFENGVQVPKPLCLIDTLFPDLNLGPDELEIPYYTLVANRIRGGVSVPDLNPNHGGKNGLKGRDIAGERRKHMHLKPRQMKEARRQYYEQLQKVHDLGIVVYDSAVYWNLLYVPNTRKLYLMDQSLWFMGTSRELGRFQKRITERARVMHLAS